MKNTVIEAIVCTYNGEKYIEDQLKSLLFQTRRINFVNIYDDQSEDSTVEKILNFIADNKLDNWTLKVNEQRKGWKLNFYDAIFASVGDIVFFCDQDDFWHDDKVEIMSRAMEENDFLSVSGLQYTMDENGRFIESELCTCAKRYDYQIKNEKFKDNSPGRRWCYRIGCAMAIDRRMVGFLRKYFKRDDHFLHDIWAVNLSALLDKRGLIYFPSINYRLHGNNASVDLKKRSNALEYTIEAIIGANNFFDYFIEGLKEMREDGILSRRQIKRALKYQNWLHVRQDVFKDRNVKNAFKLVKFLFYYDGLKRFIIEFILAAGYLPQRWL